MLKAAKKLYDLGFAIHVLKPKSKAPIEAKWTTGSRKPWNEITKTLRPGHNLGTRLGRASKIGDYYLSIIDCDVKSKKPEHLKELNDKLSELLTVATPIVVSGRGNGSRHHYVKTKSPVTPRRYCQSSDKVEVLMPSVKPSQNDLKALGTEKVRKGLRLRPAWEISIMGEGQQVVVPPSVHPDSGLQYAWGSAINSPDDIPLVDLGASDVVTRDKKSLDDFKPVSVDLITSELSDDMVALIVEGTGCEGDKSASLYSACLAMSAARFSDVEILSVLTDESNYLGDVGYRHGNTSSRKKAAQWISNYSLSKARLATGVDQYFNDEPEEKKLSGSEKSDQEKEILGEGVSTWRARIVRNKDTNRPLITYTNIKLILTNAIAKNMVARNNFSIEDTWQVETPWGSKAGSVVSDTDSINIKDWLAHNYSMEPGKEKIEEVLIQIASENQFHPVKDYLNGLKWDGVPRVKTWLIDYLKAVGPREYVETVGLKTLVAMVARIYEPGCKFDNVLILEGMQGIGKSSAAKILASGKWFSDSELNPGDKDSIVNMQGIWVYEIGELSALSRYDVNRMKEFISRSTDKMRPPYGRRMVSYPRQCVFIGTTNNDDYLKDATGNRRYWPVKCGGRVRLKSLERDRDQLLAEAKELFMLGEEIWVQDSEINKIIQKEQSLRVEVDSLQERIAEYLETENLEIDKSNFRVVDLIDNCPAIAGLRNDRMTQMRVANSLKNLGFKKSRKRVKNVNAIWWSKLENIGMNEV